MVIVTTFSINPVPSDDDKLQCFDFIGSIDANASAELDGIKLSADGPSVLLNFSQVERVNSMGLSLLLKLFEEWELAGIQVQVCNLNRMINMLFKITGLGRFVRGQKATLGAAAGGQAKEPTEPFSVPKPKVEKTQVEQSASATLKFMANLQTGEQLSGWYLLNTYLQRRLERPIHLEQPQLGQDIAEVSADLLFSKPFDACSMMQTQGFVPLMRPIGEADEVVILMRTEDDRKLEDMDKPRVVTTSKNSFVYILGRSLCDEEGQDSSTFDYQFAGNEIKALQMLVKGKADVLFMLQKTYAGLSSFARGVTRLVDESATHFAYHLFCVAPYLSELHEPLAEIFTEMETTDQGKQVLDDIQIGGWCKPDEGEIKMLELLYNRYRVI